MREVRGEEQNMKKILLGGVLAVFAFVISVNFAFAAGSHPTFGTFVNAGDVPAGSKLVININYKVTNDEDSGNVGYWALDNYNKQVKVWQVPDGSYYTVAKYIGKWQTFAGALSPGIGTPQTNDASGSMQGGYTATFDAPSCISAFGNLESKDFGGTEADVLLGTYGAGQTGPTPYSFLGGYCNGYENFNLNNWGWKYSYKNQTWNNFDYGTTGDIVVQ